MTDLPPEELAHLRRELHNIERRSYEAWAALAAGEDPQPEGNPKPEE